MEESDPTAAGYYNQYYDPAYAQNYYQKYDVAKIKRKGRQLQYSLFQLSGPKLPAGLSLLRLL